MTMYTAPNPVFSKMHTPLTCNVYPFSQLRQLNAEVHVRHPSVTSEHCTHCPSTGVY